MLKSYSELPIGKYERILAIAEEKLEDEAVQNVRILAELTGMTEDALLALPMTEFRDLMDGAEFLLVPAEPAKLRRSYKVGDYVLEPVRDYKRMTAGQFIAWQQFTAAGDRFLAERLSTMFVPKGKEYGEDYDTEDVVDAIREHLAVTDALALSAFFLNRLQRSLDAILVYLGIEMKRARKKGLTTDEDVERLRAATTSARGLAGSLVSMQSARLCVALGRNVRG